MYVFLLVTYWGVELMGHGWILLPASSTSNKMLHKYSNSRNPYSRETISRYPHQEWYLLLKFSGYTFSGLKVARIHSLWIISQHMRMLNCFFCIRGSDRTDLMLRIYPSLLSIPLNTSLSSLPGPHSWLGRIQEWWPLGASWVRRCDLEVLPIIIQGREGKRKKGIRK